MVGLKFRGVASAATDPRGTKTAAKAAIWTSLTTVDAFFRAFGPLVASIRFRSFGIIVGVLNSSHLA